MTVLAALILMPQGAPAKVEWDAKLKVVQQQFAQWHPDRIKTAFDFAIKAPLPMAKGVWKRLCEDHKEIELWYDKELSRDGALYEQIDFKRERMYKSFREDDLWLWSAKDDLEAVRDLYSTTDSDRARGVISLFGGPGEERQPKSEGWYERPLDGVWPVERTPQQWALRAHRKTVFEAMLSHRWGGRAYVLDYGNDFNDPIAIEGLLKLAEDKNAFVASSAISRFGPIKQKDKRIDDAVVSGLSSKWAIVRHSAIWASKSRRPAGAEPALRKLTADPHPQLAGAAREALKAYFP